MRASEESDTPERPELLPSAPAYLLRHLRRIFQSWDFALATVIAFLLLGITGADLPQDVLHDMYMAELQIAIALLGVVLAGLAILVGFLSPEHLRRLDQLGDGLQEDFFSFWFTGFLTVLAALSAFAALLLLHMSIDRTLPTALSLLLFLWALFAVFGLLRFVAEHGVFRARMPPDHH